MNVLNTYLTDIVNSIDMEIKNSARSGINWREKKNPKLLSRFINNDENINTINRSINKITGQNYMEIINEITQSLEDGINTHNLSDYTKYIFDSIIKKCLFEEAFCKDYVLFLTSFSGIIAQQINTHINKFIDEIYNVLDNKVSINGNPYFGYVKDVMQYKNIGVILGNMCNRHTIMQLASNVKTLNINYKNMCENMMSNVESINNLIDWIPVNMDDLNVRVYLLIGIFESAFDNLSFHLTLKDIEIINECLNTIYTFSSISNKIKFKISIFLASAT
jgi:hypothetical protein